MSQFRSVGGLDDPISDDGDRGFMGVNQRMQLNQLQPGEVRESLNGRMDGFWKPRKAVVSRSQALTGGGNPLNLPFFIFDTIFKAITAVSYTATPTPKVTITVASHGLVVGEVGNAAITGLTFTGTDNNGTKSVTVESSSLLSFPVTGITDVVLGTTPRISQLLINDTSAADVRASCLFSDPNESNQEYIIVALNTFAQKINLSTYEPLVIPYPPGASVGEGTDMIQVFDKVMLFRKGMQALEWYPNGRPVLLASQSGTLVTMTVEEHGLSSGATVVIAGLTGGVPANGTFVVTATGQDTFTYTFTSQSVPSFGVVEATMTDGFTVSPGGVYTQPQIFICTGTQVSATGGLVSLTVTGNLTIATGDPIVVYENTIPALSQLLGNEYQVFFASTTSIQFYAPVGNISSSVGSNQIQVGGRFSVGGGFMHQPGAPWGTYFQRRLWVPYYYDQSGPYNAPIYKNRKITDEVSASDILDTTTFDKIENQFRITGGTSDFVVAMHGFYDDGLVVLNRNSLHIVANTQGSLSDTIVKELTNEVGCLARKTVIMQGSNMLFLSDNGVYALTFQDMYNLRGVDEPLSKVIQPYIDRINKSLADKAVAIYYNNRYYLSVPLDSFDGANDALGNNVILVFNFLNKAWESLDTYGDSGFYITNFIVAGAGARDNLYAVTSNGGLHQIDASDSPNDLLSIASAGGLRKSIPINAVLTTRGYDLNSLGRKRFTDVQIQMQNLTEGSGEGEYSISFSAEDPDNAQIIGTTTDFLNGEVLSPSYSGEAETANVRARLGGIRGYTGTIILTRTQGSPKIHSVRVSGSETNRQIISQK